MNRNNRSAAIHLATICTMILATMLLALLGNITLTTRRKIAVQHRADLAALAAGQTISRGLNEVTAANHLVGEIVALLVLQEAIGGPELAEGKKVETAESRVLDLQLRIAENNPLNSQLRAVTQHARAEMYAGAMLYDARMRLKELTLVAHGLMSSSYAAQTTPFTAWLAPILYGASIALAAKVQQELIALDVIEQAAKANRHVTQMYRRLLPGLSLLGKVAAVQVPLTAGRAAEEIGQRNGAICAVYPRLPLLPIEAERVTTKAGMTRPSHPGRWLNPSRKSLPKRDLTPFEMSQGMRAAYPWMEYWRRDLLQMMQWTLTLSGAHGSYLNWSNYYSLSMLYDLDSQGTRFYVLRDTARHGKGNEPWTKLAGSRRADALFGVMGFAQQTGSAGWGPSAPASDVFGSAQSMVYNTNPQTGPRSRSLQPEVGWDTLNWNGPVPEYPTRANTTAPAVNLGWRCKLTPTSRLPEAIRAAGTLPAPFSTTLRQMSSAAEVRNH